MNFSIHQASKIGDRKSNQDRVAYAYSKDTLLLVLADGMGGHLHGELAASLAMDAFMEGFNQYVQSGQFDPQNFLTDTMKVAHLRIMALPKQPSKGFPGTTCVAALIQNGQIYWGHAGDSRLYLLRNNRVLTRTLDHSMVQLWLQWGVIDEEEARTHPKRNQITNCLGGAEDLFEIELAEPVILQSGDLVFLCSDGLSGPFVDKELITAFDATPVEQALDELITRAVLREAGRSDNATGLAMRWGKGEAAHDTEVAVNCVLAIS